MVGKELSNEGRIKASRLEFELLGDFFLVRESIRTSNFNNAISRQKLRSWLWLHAI